MTTTTRLMTASTKQRRSLGALGMCAALATMALAAGCGARGETVRTGAPEVPAVRQADALSLALSANYPESNGPCAIVSPLRCP